MSRITYEFKGACKIIKKRLFIYPEVTNITSQFTDKYFTGKTIAGS